MKTSHTIYTSFAKRLAIILTLLLTLGVTSAWGAEEELVYTLDGTTTGGTNAYDSGSEITQSEITWQVTGNTTMSPWRIGGKSIENKDRTVYSTKAIEDNISKIVITHGTASSITVNSMKVIVSTTQNGGGTVISTLTPTFKVNGDVTIERPDGKDWSKAFYKIVYNVTVSASKNNYIEFTSAKFYKTTAPSTFSVTYNANGATGSVPTDANEYASGAKVTAKSHGNLVKEGFSFAGWKRSDDSSIVQENTTFNMPASNLTLTAQWAAKALTNYRTSCTEPCEQLGVATGLSVQTDYVDNGQTYVKFSWTPANNTKDHATKQVICIGKVGEEKKCTDLEKNQNWSGDLRSKLTPGEYEWTIQAIGNGETYCDGEVISGPNFTIEEPLTDNCRWVEIALEDITPEDEIVVTMGNDKTVFALGTEKITNSPKSQEITITSGMIDINQDFNYSKYTWSISTVAGGYQLQPYGTTQYLYGVASYITISSTPTTFSIFTSPENGNKCFMYTIGSTYYLGHGAEDGQTAWKRVTTYDNLLKSNTLKFYKKTCLPANKFWIDYELANITCTTNPTPSQIDQTGEDLLLEFSANDGYKLPETISVKMGETEIGNNENYCVWGKETGALLIAAEQITDNITITIEGCERLATPTNLSVPNITSTSATLSWNAVTNADEYRVCVMDGETKLQEFTTTETSVNVPNLKKNSFYTWDVVAEADDYCESQPTAWIELTTLDVYAITFNTNGGTAVESQTVDHGTKATKPANPTKTGYTFAGWYTEADTEFEFNTPIESATTLYAKWNANQYTITFLKQYGAGGTDNATVRFNSNNFSVVTIEIPTRDGYEFGGYYTETGGAGLQIVDAAGKWLKNKTGYLDASGNWIKAESVNLYAKWTKIHTITWVVNNNTETPHHTSTALDGSTIDALPMPPADDLFEDCEVNAFVGWSTDNIGFDPDPTAPTDLFKTVAEAQNKIGAISADKKFYAVYASEVEQIATFEADGLNGLSANSTLKWTHDNSGISLAISEGQRYTGSPKTFTITNGINNYCEIVAPEGKSLKKAVVSITGSNYKVNSVSSPWSLSTSSTTQTITTNTNATDLKMYATSSYQIRITQVDVTYTTYSNYITRCTALPDPVWGGATIDKTEIAVNCGETSSTNGAAKISFLKETNYNLYKDIAVEVTSGNFIIATSRDGEYSTYVTLTPTQSGTNVGTLDGKYVYVRAVAPPMSSDQLTGTITISGKQITTQVINVTATVTCNEYTLTFNDCGATKTISNFAGTSVEEMEPWAETCSEPVQYVFDGWATASVNNGTAEYEKVDFSTFTMPNNNTTILYAVYRYAEEGGEPVNGYVKVTEALADWSGDYVIVEDQKYNEQYKAIKSAYKKDYILSVANVEIVDNEVISPEGDAIWSIRKNSETENYTMYNAATGKYAYIEKDDAKGAGLGTTAKDVVITFNNNKIATIKDVNIARCFSYYAIDDEWRTYSSSNYNTGYLYRLSNKTIRYTSSLICGTIEAEDAIVTSTVEQTVKVYVPITLKYSGAASITGTSDNEAFTVVTKNDVTVGESTIEVHYKPTAYVNTANQEETATITLTTSNGATTTFNITGRCLPETFAIVAKVGNNWFALPSQGLNSETTPVGYPVKVDNNDNPTAVTSLPTKAEWALRNVYKVNGPYDRFAANGENLVFVNAENKTLYANNGNANIQTYAEYTNYAATNPERYEWVPTTTDLVTYTLKNVGRAKELSINVNATFGTHASNIASNNLRFLPINATYNPFDMQVVEWYPTKVLVQTEAALTSVSATVGGIAVANPVVTKMGGKLYEISGLPLENNPTKILTISYDSYSCSKVVPIIISRATKSVTEAPFTTLTTSAYNYSDLVVRDGAVLNITGAKNTPDKFVNVTIYPTAKVVVPENNQLSVYSLTFFGGIDDIYDGEEYTTNKYGVPQLSLKGTLGKTVTTMDYIMRVDLDQMYSLGVPYDVALADIKYWDGSAIVLGDQLYVSAYDGQARANREKQTWIYETDFETKIGAATLKAGIGYTISAEPQVAGDTYSILRMPMKSNISSGSTEEDKTVSVTGYANTKGATITDNHKGWNLLSNPYMTTISGDMGEDQLVIGYLIGTNWVADTYRYVTIPGDNGKWYYQQKFTNARLLPFKSFFVQVKEEVKDGILSFALANRQNAPARLLQQDIVPREVEFELLLSNEAQSDNMGLLISEEYTPAYEINADLEKMTGTMSVYTIYNGYTLAYNALSPLNAEEQIPVGYIVPANGEYTFDLKEDGDYDKVEHIYLIDREMDAMVDLLEETYDFYAVEKKNNNRFAISVILKSEQSDGDITTNLGEIDIHNKQPQKFFYDGELYILHDGTIYSATGHEIKTINE